jgi:RecB family exonuclease
MIAGTMDMLAVINGKQVIVDVKTGKDIYKEASYQLTAYADMLREAGQTVDDIAVLLLITGQDGEPTGKYKFETLEEDMETFLAVKRLYCSINKEKCMKINYQG